MREQCAGAGRRSAPGSFWDGSIEIKGEMAMKSFAPLRIVYAMGITFSLIATASAGDLTVRIGLEPSYPPFVITNPDGSMTGLEVDLVKEVCARTKAACEWTSMDFSGLLPALAANKIDLIPENLLQTPERASKASFTREVIYNPSTLVVAKDWSGGFSNEDLAGKRIGVYKGSGQLKMLNEEVKVAIPVTYESIDQEVLDLRAGRLDAILDGRLVLSEKFSKGPDADKWKIADREFFVPGLENKGSVWAVRKGNDQVLKAVNGALEAMIADCSYTKIRKKYAAIPMVRDEPASCQ
jgi:arginine/ornithine transport system substrate-binding protein